ncbi:hypothetical protein MAPG_11734 [Magnaporthiopsis poae ATCC 64411]|uniref:Uncharacterized protein n=1 Tax=Magnaporthiopsis poae (strain ATCC 64411 / 73-15) TaxID=644358 RepID=A0A0C4EG20_MAGP6|nr:hypothetical protein MAPG_11734 [Magnaporthiopsis poae ATCC 64411]
MAFPTRYSPWLPFLLLLLIPSLAPPALADGTGMIGWGKTMYNPPCAFACRSDVRNCNRKLLCTPPPGGKLRVGALARLDAARVLHDRHGPARRLLGIAPEHADRWGALPTIKARQPLNATSFVAYEDWLKPYNGAVLFETNEIGHSSSAIGSCSSPSSSRGLRAAAPGSGSTAWPTSHPAAFGRQSRGATVPTRGQLLYILLVSVANAALVLAPYHYAYSNSTYPTRRNQGLATVGNRAGSMAMSNAAALFVFSARKNPLLLLSASVRFLRRAAYEYNWGYEIWVWIAVGVWDGDRVVRLVRTARNGLRTAEVSAVDGSGGEYLWLEVDGVRVDGVVYLPDAAPLMFWENLPFSREAATKFNGS